MKQKYIYKNYKAVEENRYKDDLVNESYKYYNRGKVKKTKKKKNPQASKKAMMKNSSKGELKIMSVLNRRQITYFREKQFANLVNPLTNAALSVDFYLPFHNTFIEFDGKQHFEYVPEYHGKDELLGAKKLQQQKFRDNIKNQYCVDNNINIIRISYLQFDSIEDILIKELSLLDNLPIVE